LVIREHVSFAGSQGATLVGRLESPADRPAACALLAHCFTCSKDLRAAGLICHELTSRGIAVLRFDFTGIGESGGDFSASNFSSNVQDIVAAAEFLRRRGLPPALLVGHSLGGTAVLAAARHVPEAVAVATIAAPSDTAYLHHKLAARLGAAPDPADPANPADPSDPSHPQAGGSDAAEGVELDLGGTRPVRIRRQLLDDLAADHLHGAAAQLGRPLLIFHSPLDRVVGIEHAERLFLAARHPKSFVSLGAADHLLSDPRDAAQAGAVLATWAERYLPARPQEAAARPPEAAAGQPEHPPLPPGEVEVTGEPGALRQDVTAGTHTLVADEPVAQGGSDAGPTPYGLLLAALGACTSMTLRLYADRKKIPLAGVRVRLRHSRVHAADCERCEAATGADARLERIERDLELRGPLTEQQRIRLHEIADRCPVHRTLTSHVDIVTRLL
jgi:uncharacterized OsmC-like protein/pimeloyl-ACP methyl ester carboxylesterase